MSNLTNTTRALWIRTLKHQVIMRIPVLNSMLKRNLIVTKGGTSIDQTVGKTDMESLAQAYSGNDPLTSSTKDLYDKPSFAWKTLQVPIEVSGTEEIQNASAGDHKIIDLAKDMTKQGQRGLKYAIRTSLFEAGSATSDSDKGFQGFADALTHDLTYGGLARATTATRKFWQGASIADTMADYSTARSMNIETCRQAIRASGKYADRNRNDIKINISPTNFIKLQNEMETRMLYKGPTGELGKQGFEAMELDNVEIVSDYYLDTSATLQAYFYLLHLPDWEFRVHPKRNFRLTDPVWQGQIINGTDKYLSRVLLAGNCVCWQPNASMFLSSVS